MNAPAGFLDQTHLRVLLYEGEGAQPMPPETRGAVLRELLLAGHPVSVVQDTRAIQEDNETPIILMGNFGGQAPSTTSAATTHLLDLTDLPTADIPDRVEALREEAGTRKPGEWHPWFPVIDYDRCTNCMQCLSFCLFGVYGISEDKKIQVQNNDKCKTNCPACSRVCPEAAIMFPKYRNGPVNGDEVSDADMQRESMKVDISALLGGDIYSTLRTRTKQAKERFTKERDDDRALAERQRCLAKMQKEMDIPAEVLMSLPSPAEIARRAEEAKAKAEEALGWHKGSSKVEERE